MQTHSLVKRHCPDLYDNVLTVAIAFGYGTMVDAGWDVMNYTINVLDTLTGKTAIGGNISGNPEPVYAPDWLNQIYITEVDGATPNNSTAGQWINLINGYAKAVYCTVLSDLGQSAPYNMLASPESGQTFVMQIFNLSNMLHGLLNVSASVREEWSDFACGLGIYNDDVLPEPPPQENSTDFFNWFGIAATPRHNSSTISAEYVCQVPVLKPWGSLLVSVLVADLVFLQVLWMVLNSIVTFMVERGQEEAK